MIHPEITRGEELVLKLEYSTYLGRSHFESAFIDLVKFSDPANLERLALGFPEEVAAFHSYWKEKDWWKNLKAKAIKLNVIPKGV